MTDTETGQYRVLLKHSQSGILIYAPDTHLIYWNDEATRIWGVTTGELSGLQITTGNWSFISEDGTRLAPEDYPVLRIRNNPIPFSNLILGIEFPDGREITWVKVNAYPEFNEEGEITQIVVLLADITEQIIATDNYRLKRYVFDNAREGILMTEVRPDSAIIFCANPEFTQNSGYSEQEIKGKDIRLLSGPDTDPLIVDQIFEKIKEGKPFQTTLRCSRKNGDTFWCALRIAPAPNQYGRITHYMWYLTDITWKKEINNEMVISRKVLEQAQKVARIGHFVLDMQTNTIVSSPSFDDILGLDVSLPKSVENCLGHILPEFQGKIWNRLQEIMQNGGRFAEDFITVRPVDGEQRWISAFGELNHDTEKKTVTLNGVIQDISERKQAEAAAELAQRDLQSIISIFPDIVLRFNAAYEFTYCHANNPEDLLMPEEQLIGKRVDDVMPPEIVQIIHEKAEKTRISGKVESFEYFLPINTPEKIWFEARMINTTQDEIVCVIRNITEQKHAANAQKESEQLLRDIFNMAPVPLIISSITDGKIIMVNEALEKLIGVPFSKFKNLSTLKSYDKPEERVKMLQKLAEKGRVRNEEITLKKYNGTPIPCLLSTELVTMNGEQLIFSGIIDISERKKSEEALQHNEQLLRDIFNFSPIALIVAETETGKVIMANEKAAKLAGISIAEVSGKSIIDFYANPEDRQQLLAGVKAFGKVESMEVKFKNPAGQINFGLISTNIIYMNGEKMLFTGYIDINERKKMEGDLNNSLNLVREQNKRLLNFSYIVSHNLRSHTSNIKTILDFIENASSPKEREDMIRHLRTVASRLDDTLYDLNEVVSIQKNINLVIEPLALHDYVDRSKQVLSELINLKKAVVNNSVAPDFWVNYNPAYLESILLNLLSNALKYSHPERQPVVNISCSVSGNRTILEISDNGLGIDLVKNKDKIFGMYKTFHGNKDAKGLGLFICKNQVEAMGGTLEVESEPNIGTTFKISFV